MAVALVTLFLAVVLPWGVGCYFLLSFVNPKKGGAATGDIWTGPVSMWFMLLPAALLPPFFVWQSRDVGSSAHAVEQVLQESVSRSWDTLVHIVKFVIPFAIYPMILFWIKIVVNQRADAQEQGDAFKGVNTRNPRAQSQQAQLISFVVKILVMIFVFFAVLDKVGISTGDVLEITTVFSLGLSWSMRDWLSSLWAAFMIAMTTELTSGSLVTLNPLSPNNSQPLRVVRTGLLYTACIRTPQDDTKASEFIYISNSSLLNNGFSITLGN